MTSLTVILKGIATYRKETTSPSLVRSIGKLKKIANAYEWYSEVNKLTPTSEVYKLLARFPEFGFNHVSFRDKNNNIQQI